MHLFFGSDHNGFEIEKELITWLTEEGHEVTTFSNPTFSPTDDYPDFAFPVAEAVAKNPHALGIVMCASGGGVCLVANKYPNARCILAMNKEQAYFGRKDDNANILALSIKYSSLQDIKTFITTFIETPFETGGRHERRFQKVMDLEKKVFK